MIASGTPPSNIRGTAARIGCLLNRQAGVRWAYHGSTEDRTGGRRPARGTTAAANLLPCVPTPRATARRSQSHARVPDRCTGVGGGGTRWTDPWHSAHPSVPIGGCASGHGRPTAARHAGIARDGIPSYRAARHAGVARDSIPSLPRESLPRVPPSCPRSPHPTRTAEDRTSKTLHSTARDQRNATLDTQ